MRTLIVSVFGSRVPIAPDMKICITPGESPTYFQIGGSMEIRAGHIFPSGADLEFVRSRIGISRNDRAGIKSRYPAVAALRRFPSQYCMILLSVMQMMNAQGIEEGREKRISFLREIAADFARELARIRQRVWCSKPHSLPLGQWRGVFIPTFRELAWWQNQNLIRRKKSNGFTRRS